MGLGANPDALKWCALRSALAKQRRSGCSKYLHTRNAALTRCRSLLARLLLRRHQVPPG